MLDADVHPAPAVARSGSGTGWLRAVEARTAGRESDMLLATGVIAIAIAMLWAISRVIFDDTWLALVAGRQIAATGIPHHELLIAFAHGHAWIDQQWLSQLTMYGLHQIGGIALTSVVNVALICAAIAAAVLGARRLGASGPSVAWVMPIAVMNVVIAAEVRTQVYAYPLFVATAFLLARDSRRPSRRVYLCLPLLVLWANLHGSATLGAGLVALRGLTIGWERRTELRSHARAWLRPAVLVLGAPVCLLATPYGLSTISYYRATLLNGSLSKYVTEWQPVTAVPVVAGLVMALAAVTLWWFGRAPGQTTLWERCALIALAGMAIFAIRNVVWFGMAEVLLLPLAIDAAVRARTRAVPPRTRLNLALVAAAAALLVIMLAVELARPDSSFRRGFPQGALAAVETATRSDPSLRVFADERFSDWLLWNDRALSGRVAYDARFELLSTHQFTAIIRLKHQLGAGWKAAARGYRLLVFDPATVRDAARAFTREPGARVLYDSRDAEVILRARAAAAQ